MSSIAMAYKGIEAQMERLALAKSDEEFEQIWSELNALKPEFDGDGLCVLYTLQFLSENGPCLPRPASKSVEILERKNIYVRSAASTDLVTDLTDLSKKKKKLKTFSKAIIGESLGSQMADALLVISKHLGKLGPDDVLFISIG